MATVYRNPKCAKVLARQGCKHCGQGNIETLKKLFFCCTQGIIRAEKNAIFMGQLSSGHVIGLVRVGNYYFGCM